MSSCIIDSDVFAERLRLLMIEKGYINQLGKADPIKLHIIVHPEDETFNNAYKNKLKDDLTVRGRLRRQRNWLKGHIGEIEPRKLSENELPNLCETKRILEEFGCDLDYLEGKSNYKTRDIEFICNKTGLSQEAVIKLTDMIRLYPNKTKILNRLLLSDNFDNLLTDLSLLEDSLYPVYAAQMHNRRIDRTALHNMEINELHVSDDLAYIRMEFRTKIENYIKTN